MSDDKGQPKAAAKGPVRKAPEVWAFELGYCYPRRKPFQQQKLPDTRHSAASGMHGWQMHAYQEAGPMMLTRQEYEGAIKAVMAGYEPHAPALSKYMAPLWADRKKRLAAAAKAKEDAAKRAAAKEG